MERVNKAKIRSSDEILKRRGYSRKVSNSILSLILWPTMRH